MALKNGKGRIGTAAPEESQSATTVTRKKKPQASEASMVGLVKRKGSRKPSGSGRSAENKTSAQEDDEKSSSTRLEETKQQHASSLRQLVGMFKDVDGKEKLKRETESAVLDHIAKVEAQSTKNVDSFPLVELLAENMKRVQDADLLFVVVKVGAFHTELVFAINGERVFICIAVFNNLFLLLLSRLSNAA